MTSDGARRAPSGVTALEGEPQLDPCGLDHGGRASSIMRFPRRAPDVGKLRDLFRKQKYSTNETSARYGTDRTVKGLWPFMTELLEARDLNRHRVGENRLGLFRSISYTVRCKGKDLARHEASPADNCFPEASCSY
jgi:hypothetical protein